MSIAASNVGNNWHVSGAGTITLTGVKRIKTIKYYGAATSSATITSNSVQVWSENATTNVWNEHLSWRGPDDVVVTITGTASLDITVP